VGDSVTGTANMLIWFDTLPILARWRTYHLAMESWNFDRVSKLCDPVKNQSGFSPEQFSFFLINKNGRS
jgi:hypothetical protein